MADKMGARLYLRLPEELNRAFRDIAERQYLKPSEAARRAIAEFVSRYRDGAGAPAVTPAPAPSNGGEEA